VSTTSTIVAGGNQTQTAINTILKNDIYYALALNFSQLYAESSSCTPALYSSTFVNANGHAPTGVFSYQNVSQETPYALVQQTKSLGNQVYEIDFITKTADPGFNNSIAIAITVNLATRASTSDVIKGIFQGEGYSTLLANYQSSAAVGNACAALIG
jgi:hypothetical protein